MKRFIFTLLLLYPLLLIQAGVIMKKTGERLEDVSIESVSGTEIVYISPSGESMTMPISEASAVLYDDGRYEEIKKGASPSDIHTGPTISTQPVENTEVMDLTDAKEYNVYAFGIYGMIGYFAKEEYDGATVEYRVIYKKQGATEFKFLGTAPFAYVTQKAYDSPIMHTNAAFSGLMSVNPLVVPNAKDMKKIEFRLSKEGYKTVIVQPIKDVLLSGGPLLMLPMNKLKPLGFGESNDEVIAEGGIATTASAPAEPVIAEPAAPAAPDYSQYQDGQIHKLSSNRYYFVDTLYNKKELKNILLSCPETERICKNARKWIIGGWSGVAGGAALTIIGGCLVGVTATSSAGGFDNVPSFSGIWDPFDPDPSYGGGNRSASNVDAAQISGFLLIGLGAGGLVSSFAIACIGHRRMNNAYKVYNSSCINQPSDLSMNFGFTRNGLGMRINF